MDVQGSAPGLLQLLPATRGHAYGAVHAGGQSHIHMGDTYNSFAALPLRSQSAFLGDEVRQALYYNGMEKRRAQLASHDTKSFRCVWTDTLFPVWLTNINDGIFWIKGKPGSGKSTLMQHLTSWVDSHTVLHCLRHSHSNPTIAHYFFDFRAGTGLANSLVGMYRAILLQLMEQSDEVKTFLSDRYGYGKGGTWSELDGELADALCCVIQFQDILLCAFIDGLDEYMGNKLRLVRDLVSLQKRCGHALKLCLASRPDTVLTMQLTRFATIEMQQHNSSTIYEFSTQALEDLQDCATPEDISNILQQITQHAEGVFLWAQFVIEEIPLAIMQGRSGSDILDILDTYPQELDGVYDRQWLSLSHNQRRQATVILYATTAFHYPYVDDIRLFCQRTLSKSGWIKLHLPINDARHIQFIYQVHNLLGNLLEVCPSDTPNPFRGGDEDEDELRIVHRSLSTWLAKTSAYQEEKAVIETILIPGFVEEGFLAENLRFCSGLMPHDPLLLCDQYRIEDLRVCGHDALLATLSQDTDQPLSKRQIYRTRTYLRFLVPNWGRPGFDLLEAENLVYTASQSWLFRHQWLYHHDIAELSMPLAFIAGVSTLQSRPEILAYISFPCPGLFRDALQSTLLGSHDLDVLLAEVFDDVLWLRGFYNEDNANPDIDKYEMGKVRLESVRHVLIGLLGHCSLAARVVGLCLAPTNKLHLLQGIRSRVVDASSAVPFRIPTSIWFQCEPIHFLFAWAKSPYGRESKSALTESFTQILGLGIDLYDTVFAGGNVMHAIFDPLPLHGFPSQRRRFTGDGFSIQKFDILLEHGISIGKDGGYLSVAHELEMRLKQHCVEDYCFARFAREDTRKWPELDTTIKECPSGCNTSQESRFFYLLINQFSHRGLHDNNTDARPSIKPEDICKMSLELLTHQSMTSGSRRQARDCKMFSRYEYPAYDEIVDEMKDRAPSSHDSKQSGDFYWDPRLETWRIQLSLLQDLQDYVIPKLEAALASP